jgi:protein O-GlcNAc transferase
MPSGVSETHFAQALRHHQSGRLDEAESAYAKTIVENPLHLEALNNLATIHRKKGNIIQAIGYYQRAIAVNPSVADIHNNLGNAYTGAGRLNDAANSFREAIRLKPKFADAVGGLVKVLQQTTPVDSSIAELQAITLSQPDFYEAHRQLAMALWAKGDMKAAAEVFKKATTISPDSLQAWIDCATSAQNAGEVDEAFEACRRVLLLDPSHADTHQNLGNLFLTIGQPTLAVASLAAAVANKPDSPMFHSHLLFSLHFDPSLTPHDILREHRVWNDRYISPLKSSIRPHNNPREKNRRLRIGYISCDFNRQVVGRNILPLLREHSHSDFEIFSYYHMPVTDDFTLLFQQYSDHWKVVSGTNDHDVADLVRKDQIDILVDLALHMRGSPMAIFAEKPAPVQITFAGYPSTTGSETIDYRLSDPWLDPPGNDSNYSETTIRLPDSFWCYDAQGMELQNCPPVSVLPALSAGHITFGCLNNLCKVNDRVLNLWGRVMEQIPNSRLSLLGLPGTHQQRIVKSLGVTSDRVKFFSPRQRDAYFEIYNGIDLGPDTFPYNGHTTSLDSLWMGVPVVSMIGQSAVGRAALSQMSNLGLATDFVADSESGFIDLAIHWANHLEKLAALRQQLRDRMQRSPLMDSVRFTRSIESAYRQAWQNYCDKPS